MNFFFGQIERQNLSEDVEACLLCPTNNINNHNNNNNHNDDNNEDERWKL